VAAEAKAAKRAVMAASPAESACSLLPEGVTTDGALDARLAWPVTS